MARLDVIIEILVSGFSLILSLNLFSVGFYNKGKSIYYRNNSMSKSMNLDSYMDTTKLNIDTIFVGQNAFLMKHANIFKFQREFY